MGCGSWCVYYRDRDKLAKGGVCTNCSDYEGKRARFDLGKIDIFRLGKLLREKQEKEKRGKIPKLSDCPYCYEHSLFYNLVDDKFECLNLKCQAHSSHIIASTGKYKSILHALLGHVAGGKG